MTFQASSSEKPKNFYKHLHVNSKYQKLQKNPEDKLQHTVEQSQTLGNS